MKRAAKEHSDPDLRAEYDFKLGQRGKYASRFKEAAVDGKVAPGKVHSWAPLLALPWSGSEKQITGDTWIRGRGAYIGYSATDFKRYLSRDEREQCREAEHWLQIDQPVHSALSSPAAINSFLVALWVVAPTRTHIPLRFEEAKGQRTVARLLDRFQWIEGQALDGIQGKQLEETGRLLRPLRDVYENGRRLRNALVLSFQGCLSRQWQVAFVCLAAAAEAILSDSTERGLGQRLADNFAALTATDEAGRKDARARFRRLYGIRSVIVHGRAHGRREAHITLKDLAEFSDLVRGLWRIVLEDSNARAALEAGDEQRQLLFRTRA
jgi:hypothetical protein